MESVLLHIYPDRDDDANERLSGVYGYVEFIDGESNLPFKDQDELWSILTSHIKNLKEGK